MRIGFNRHFYRSWPFWVGVLFLVGDALLRLIGLLFDDPLGVVIGLMWLFVGLFFTTGGHAAPR